MADLLGQPELGLAGRIEGPRVGEVGKPENPPEFTQVRGGSHNSEAQIGCCQRGQRRGDSSGTVRAILQCIRVHADGTQAIRANHLGGDTDHGDSLVGGDVAGEFEREQLPILLDPDEIHRPRLLSLVAESINEKGVA